MFLNEFQLLKFGHFENRTFSFGNQPGFHLIYGPNEAGKSTFLRAFRHFFEGIPARTRDGHLYPLNTLRIGASLKGQKERRFIRRKGRFDTLLDVDGGVVPEDELLSFLGGLGVEQYLNLFVLDQHRLVSGGRDLLDGKGDLGRSLFGAIMGARDLGDVLKELEEELMLLHKPRSHAFKPKLNEAVHSFRQCKRSIQESSLSVREWESMQREMRTLEEKRKELVEKREEHLSELSVIQKSRETMVKRESWEGELEGLRQQIAMLTKEQDSLSVNEQLLKQEPLLRSLHEQVGAVTRYKKECSLIDEELKRAERELEKTRKHLGEDIPLEMAQLQTHVIETHRVQESLSLLKKEEKELQVQQKELKKNQGKERSISESLKNDLEVLLERMEKEGDLEETLRSVEEDCEKEKQCYETLLKHLPGEEFIHEAIQRELPEEEEVIAVYEELNRLKRKKKTLEESLRELQSALLEVQEEQKEISKQQQAPSLQEYFQVRQEQEQAWTEIKQAYHQQTLTKEHILTFEATKGRFVELSDDVIQYQFLSSRRNTLIEQEASLFAKVKRAKEDMEEVNKEREKEKKQAMNLFLHCPDQPQGEKKARQRILDYQTLIEHYKNYDSLKREESSLKERREDYRNLVSLKLGKDSLGEEFQSHKKALQKALKRAEREEIFYEKFLEEERALDKKFDLNQKKQKELQPVYQSLMMLWNRWLPQALTTWPSSQVQEQYTEYYQTHSKIKEQKNKLEKEREKKKFFIKSFECSLAELIPDFKEESSEEAFKNLYFEWEQSKKNQDQKVHLEKTLREKKKKEEEIQKSLSSLPDKHRKENEHQDPSQLEKRFQELQSLIQEIDDQLKPLDENRGHLSGKLAEISESDVSVIKRGELEEYRTQIKQYADEALELILSMWILRRAGEGYRQRNQGNLVNRGGEIFRKLTLERFYGLRVSMNENGEPFLVGIRENGSEVFVEGMSEGTADQLYLSLRLACLEEILKRRGPYPFVMDDVLVHFDERRSRAALEVFSELGKKTQVLYLTHQESIRDLSLDLPHVFVHDMTKMSSRNTLKENVSKQLKESV